VAVTVTSESPVKATKKPTALAEMFAELRRLKAEKENHKVLPME
jgi:hypothetical protein